ncbi:MAG: M4 family metallopeptidase [Clostridia bacterium]|nr:M4 family metallopeptidase [Clostridia bacterium]
MKRIIISITACVVVLVMLCGLLFFIFNKDDKKTQPAVDTSNILSVDDAITYFEETQKDYGYKNALSELSVKNNSSINGDSYYRLQQNYKGLPVYGRSVVCAANKSGEITSLTGNLMDVEESINLIPTVSSEQVSQSVKKYLLEQEGYENVDSLNIESLDEEDLCIYNIDGVYLAYCVNVYGYEILVDAHSADFLLGVPTMFTANDAEIGYMFSDINREKGFPVDKIDNYYVMKDVNKGLSVYTFKGQVSKDENGFHSEIADAVVSEDILFGNTEKEKKLAYENGSQLLLNVIDIQAFFNELGFSNDVNINLYYNDGFDGGENALGGTSGNLGVVSMGTVMGVDKIDVIAHEYTHFVSRRTVDWIGQAENGAINEAMSDIFGELIEAKIQNRKVDWKMYNFRNIAKPQESKNPSSYKGNYWGSAELVSKENDYGNVHKNSTVISHAAYLMWNGIDGSENKKFSTVELAELWYRTMLIMPADCDFNSCKQLVILAANSMELPKDKINCVVEAFDMVGITGVKNDNSAKLYVASSNSKLYVYGGDGTLYDNYTVYISGIRKLYGPILSRVYNKKIDISDKEPYTLELENGFYSFTVSDNANPKNIYTFNVLIFFNNESFDIVVPANFGGIPVRGSVSVVEEIAGIEINKPISDAAVKISSDGGASYESVDFTDIKSVFETYVSDGDYSIIVESKGYKRWSGTFTAGFDKDVYINILLEREIFPVLEERCYDSEGILKNEKTCEYTERGLLKCETYKSCGVLQERLQYEYNSNDILIRKTKEYGTRKTVEEYDETGKLVRETITDGTSEWIHNYDNNSTETEGEKIPADEYVYDDSGNLIVEKSWYNNERADIFYYYYDQEGRLIFSYLSQHFGDIPSLYDENGQLLRRELTEEQMSTWGSYCDIYEYDESGNLIKHEQHAEDDYVDITLYTYDEQNRVSSVKSYGGGIDYDDAGIYTYEYDEYGNVLRKIWSKRSVTQKIWEYKYDYSMRE